MYGFSVLIKKADICCEYPFFFVFILGLCRGGFGGFCMVVVMLCFVFRRV